MARVTGSKRNDLFTFDATQISSLQVRAGLGYDTLKVTGAGHLVVDAASTSQWRELEALNLSTFSGSMSLAVSPTLLANSNTGAFDITVGTASLLTLSATTAGVVLHGTGEVQLSDATTNMVKLASSSINLTGGANADTITASTAGNRLDGGGGDDTLIGNAGSDTFVHAGASGHDTLLNFDGAVDRIDISGCNVASFHDLKNLMVETAQGVNISFADGSSVLIHNRSIADVQADDFISDGQTLPAFDDSIVIEPGTSAAEINAIIAAAPDGATVTFAAGQHNLDQSIIVNRSDISLVGEGAGTVFNFAEDGSYGEALVSVGQVQKSYVTSTTENATAGSNTLTLANAQQLSPGDCIYLYQPNTQDYLTANGWTNVTMTEAADRPFREFIARVVSVNGNQVTLDSPLPYDFAEGDTRLFTIDLLTNVAVRDLVLATTHEGVHADQFLNAVASFEGTSALAASGTDGFVLDNIVITNAPSIGMTLASSINASISGLTVNGSLNKGSGGNGYGVLLSEAFNNDVSGLSIQDVRHAVTFSAWNAEAYNQIHIADSNRDINFHGSPDLGNTVNVDHIALEYDLAVDPSVWSLVSQGGSNHAATDIFTFNSVKVSHGEGSTDVDTIHGADAGSYLNGHGSNDVLVGGTGQDVIVGGLRRDLLTGSSGADIFIFKMGDDLDTISDMVFGNNGDTIVLMGNAAVDGFSDLVFTQDGADLRLRYGSNSTIILKNTTEAQLEARNFVFDPLSQNYGDEWLGGL